MFILYYWADSPSTPSPGTTTSGPDTTTSSPETTTP